MIELRPFSSLGRFRNGWLDANYHFSFSGYHDPARVHWGALRVWNDDTIAPNTGFSPHSHADMEIVTYVRTGAITHEDNLGNKGRTEAGDVQVMSAGSGITHAEYNREAEVTTLFQLWIMPNQRGGKPFWGARKFPKGDRSGQFVPLASGDEQAQAHGALPIRQDAHVLGATLLAGQSTIYELAAGRRGYLVVAAGQVELNGLPMGPRDGAAIADLAQIEVRALADAELVLVDAVDIH